jgi:peptide/nickel transport system permease protein
MNAVIRTILQGWGCGLVALSVVFAAIFSTFAMCLGDFAKAIPGQAATPVIVAAFQRETGLDRPSKVLFD